MSGPMSDDRYLWSADGSSDTPDPFVQDLERKLACKRYRVRPLDLEGTRTGLRDVRTRRRSTATGTVRYLPLAAGVAAAVVLAVLGWTMQDSPSDTHRSDPVVEKPSVTAPIPVAKPGASDDEGKRDERTKRDDGRHVISDR